MCCRLDGRKKSNGQVFPPDRSLVYMVFITCCTITQVRFNDPHSSPLDGLNFGGVRFDEVRIPYRASVFNYWANLRNIELEQVRADKPSPAKLLEMV